MFHFELIFYKKKVNRNFAAILKLKKYEGFS